MPVLIDLEKEVSIDPKKRNLSNGVELELTPAQRDVVVMTKYVSNDPLRADFQPSGEWFEQVTADVGGGRRSSRIQVNGLGGEVRALNIDDGTIVDLVGTQTGLVGILPGRPPMNEAEVEAYVDATDEPVPLYQQWDFRIRRVLKTDGPEQRANLNRSEEQKRLNAQTDMFNVIAQAFQQGLAALAAAGNVNPNPQDVLAAGLKSVVKK